MPIRDGKDNASKEGQISITMNEGIDQILKASIHACSSITQARRVSLSAVANTVHCTAMGLSPRGAKKPTDEAVCVAAMMGYFASPTAENDGFLMEISPERWLDALNAAERILGRLPDSGLEPQMTQVLRDYQNKAANVLTNFLGSKPGQQPKDLN